MRFLVEILQLQNIPFENLSPGHYLVILRLGLAVFIQYRSVTDRHRQTDGRTDTRRRYVPRLA